jgi:ribonuclease Z
MDHWMGIDTLIRHLHAAPKTVDLFGPPGITDKMEHRLAGYDWNLAEENWCHFRVHDVHPRVIISSIFSGPEGFRRQPHGRRTRQDRVIFRNRQLQVEAETCDHRVASLIFRIDERPQLRIDTRKMTELNLVPGPWLKELKYRYSDPGAETKPLLVQRCTPDGIEEFALDDIAELCRQIGQPQDNLGIGYISDIGFTTANRRLIKSLLRGVTLLICECTFLRAAKEKARVSRHLCSDDVNQLLDDLRPPFFLPIHLSKTYNRRSRELYRELEPPPGTRLLQLPLHITPAPLRADMLEWQESGEDPHLDNQ